MKKMTTAFAMIALAATLSTTVFGQTEKRNQPGIQTTQRKGVSGQGSGDPIPTESVSLNFKTANRHRLTGAEGSHWPRLEPQAMMQRTSPKGFDKGYLSPGFRQHRRRR